MNMDINAIKFSVRGKHWFEILTRGFQKIETGIHSLLVADGQIDGQMLRVFAVVPDIHNHFPRARKGEVGLLEGWSLAKAVDQLIQLDEGKKISVQFYVLSMCRVRLMGVVKNCWGYIRLWPVQ